MQIRMFVEICDPDFLTRLVATLAVDITRLGDPRLADIITGDDRDMAIGQQNVTVLIVVVGAVVENIETTVLPRPIHDAPRPRGLRERRDPTVVESVGHQFRTVHVPRRGPPGRVLPNGQPLVL